MAKYKASPQYTVGTITFNAFGLYSTDDAKEIAALDALAPTWVTRLDEPESVAKETKEPEDKTEEAKAPDKPAAKPKAAKPSAK